MTLQPLRCIVFLAQFIRSIGVDWSHLVSIFDQKRKSLLVTLALPPEDPSSGAFSETICVAFE